jgi:gliding motility-associated-like protein
MNYRALHTTPNVLFRNKMRIVILLYFLNLLVAFGQSDTLHYFPPLHNDHGNGPDIQSLYIGTADANPVTVSIYNAGTGALITTQNITATTPYVYNVGTTNASALFTTDAQLSTVLSNKGLIIKSNKETTASFRIREVNQGDILTSKGAGGAVGKIFRVGGVVGSGNSGLDNFFAGILATENNTTLNITIPSGAGRNGVVLHSGNTTTVVAAGSTIGPIILQKGQSYVISGTLDTDGASNANNNGILGALIQADKNIALNNGNLASPGRDFFVDQAVPINKLGKQHILIKGNGNNAAGVDERGIIIATENNTVVKVNGLDPLIGNTRTPVTLNAGQYFLVEENNYVTGAANHENMYIETTKPIYMYQQLLGSDVTTGGLVLIPPFNCYQPRQVTIPLVDRVGNLTYDAELLVFTEAGATLTINGQTQATKQAVAGTGYESYKISGNAITGNLDVRSTRAMVVSLIGNNGNIGLAGAYSGFIIPDTTKIFYSDTCIGFPTRFSTIHNLDETILGFDWNFGDPSTGLNNTFISNSVDLDSAQHKFSTTGTYTITLNVRRTTCDDTVKKVVKIVGIPATIASSQTVCYNAAQPKVVFGASNGSTPYTFTYKINGGSNTILPTTGGASTVSLNAPTNVSGVYKYYLLDAKDNSGPNVCPTPLDSAVITVLNPSTVTISGATTVCQDAANPVVIYSAEGGLAPYTINYTLNSTTFTTSTIIGNNTATVNASTSIPGPYTYSLVSITDANNCTTPKNGGVQVLVQPGISGTISGDATVCKGDAGPIITLTGSNGTPNYTFAYSLGGTPQSSATSNGNSATVTAFTSTAGVFTYSLTGIQDAGNSSCSAASGTAIITVLDLPTASFGNDTVVCKDATSPNIILRGNGGGGSPYTFTYQLNSNPSTQQTTVGLASAITLNPSTASVGTSTYSVLSVRDAKSCTKAGSDIVLVTIKAPSTATANIASSDTRVCENDASPAITFTGSNGIAPYIFTYTTNFILNGATTHTIQSTPGDAIIIQVPTDNPDTLIYTLTGVQDATGIACGFANSSIEIIVDPIPKSLITAAFSDVCVGGGDQPLIFEAQNVTTLPVTFNYFKQILSVDPSPVQQTPIVSNSLTYTLMVSANTLGTSVYTNGISSDNSCSSAVIGAGSASITVHPLPTAGITANGATSICDNSTTKVRFTGAVGQPPFTFSYNINNTTTKQISTAAGTYTVDLTIDTVPGTYSVNLTAVKDLYNCNQAQSGSIIVRVDALPTAVSTQSTTICMNSATTINTATASNYSAVNWTKTTSGTLNNDNTLTPTYVSATNDANTVVTLTMTVTGTLACSSETAKATYNIAVDSLPLAIVSGNKVICENGSWAIPNARVRNANPSWTENGQGGFSTGALTLAPTYTATSADAGNAVLLTLTATSINTCSLSPSTATYTIHVDPLPQASTTGSTTICQNTSYTLTGGQATAAYGAISWSENGQGSITNGVNSLTPTYTANAADAGNSVTLTMTVTSTNQCASANISRTFSIQVDPLPISSGSGSTSICQGTDYTPSGFTAQYGSILWTENGQGSIISGNTTLSPTYRSVATDANNVVTLTMTVTSTNSCSVTNERSIRTFSLQVDPVPGATVNPVGAAICQNNSYTLQNGEAQQQYGSVLWTKENAAGSITNPTSLTPRYVANANDAGTSVTLLMTVTSTNSCKPQSTFKLYTLQIDSLPRAIKGQDKIICYNETASITGAGARNGTVRWEASTNASGVLSNETTLSPSYQAVTADAGKTIQLTLTVTSNNSCGSATSTQINSVTVRPLLTASVSLNKNTVCQNEEAKVNITANNGTGQYEFTYLEANEEKTITTVGSNKTALGGITLIPGNRIITLTNIKDANCENAATGTQTLTVFPLPDAFITEGNPACRGDAVQPLVLLTGTDTPGPYTFDYTINNEEGIIISLNGSNSALIPVNTYKATSYNYVLKSVTDANGCIVQINNQKATVTVYEVPEASFIVEDLNKTILEPEVQIQNNSLMATQYTWDFGDGYKSYQPDPEPYKYKDTGYYNIGLYVANGICTDTMIQTIRIKQPTLLYIPNSFSPNSDGVNDIFKPQGEGILKSELTIYNRWGNKIFHSDNLNIGWDGLLGNGEIAPIDTYIYTIDMKATDSKYDYTYRGPLILIR